MAKRSDFAQKLLDDLRRRKEQMGFTQAAQRPEQASSNAYGNSKRSFRGSGEATSRKPSSKSSLGTDVTQKLHNTRCSRTPMQQAASKEIVPVGRLKNTESTIDLSMALAFALSNNGNLINMRLSRSSAASEELILQRSSLDFREIEGRYLSKGQWPLTGQVPYLSQLHIGDISRGAQNLNKLLQACTKGLNFDREAIDIGRELLKGAIDLGEALRMLVSLQEASNYMPVHQGKTVHLLKGKEEDESPITKAKERMPSRKRFSFDASSRRSLEDFSKIITTGDRHVLSYPQKPNTPQLSSSNSSSNATIQLASHRRSASCNPGGSKTDNSLSGSRKRYSHNKELQSISNSKATKISQSDYSNNPPSERNDKMKQLGSQGRSEPHKVRIPNIIAKLMGLKEIPPVNTGFKDFEEKKVTDSSEGIGTDKISRVRVGGATMEVDKEEISGTELTKSISIMNRQKLLQEKTSTGFKNIEGWKVTNSREGVGIDKNSGVRDKAGIFETELTKSISLMNRQRVLQEKGNVTQATNPNDMVTSKGKSNERNLNNMEKTNQVFKSSERTYLPIDKQMNLIVTDQNRGTTNKKDAAEAGAEHKHSLKFNNQPTTSQRKGYLSEDSKHDLERTKKILFSQEQRNAKKDLSMPGYQMTPADDSESQQAYVARRSEGAAVTVPNEENKLKYPKERKTNLIVKKSTKFNKVFSSDNLLSVSSNPDVFSKRSYTGTTDKKQSKEPIKSSKVEIAGRKRSITSHETDRSKNGNLEGKRALKTDPESDIPSAQKAGMTSIAERRGCTRPSRIPFAPKAGMTSIAENKAAKRTDINPIAAHNKENPRMTQEEANEIASPAAKGHLLMQQTATLHEQKQLRHERISQNEEESVTIHALNSAPHGQEAAEMTSTVCIPASSDCRMLNRTDQHIAADNNSHDTIKEVSVSQQPPIISFKGDQEQVEESSNVNPNQAQGSMESLQINNHGSLQQQNQAVFKPDIQIIGRENEKQLRQMLVNSQQFLHTAQALFMIKIPVSIIQASKNMCQDEESKRFLDSGFEIMRRKGKREELPFNSSMKLVSKTMRERSLDDLITELNEDLESLKPPTQNEKDNYDIAEFLHKLLEKDIQNRNPDVNCMWDFGWSSTMFANLEKEEIVKDMEKHVLNGLINEMVIDLLEEK